MFIPILRIRAGICLFHEYIHKKEKKDTFVRKQCSVFNVEHCVCIYTNRLSEYIIKLRTKIYRTCTNRVVLYVYHWIRACLRR